MVPIKIGIVTNESDIHMTDRIAFQSAGAKSKARQLRDLFEAGMDFETALGCLGLTERAEEFRDRWDRWEAGL
jgi:hypothetical protein